MHATGQDQDSPLARLLLAMDTAIGLRETQEAAGTPSSHPSHSSPVRLATNDLGDRGDLDPLYDPAGVSSPPPSGSPSVSPDVAADPVAIILQQIRGAFTRLSERARRDLTDAAASGSTIEDVAVRVIAVLEKHRPELANLFGLAGLASLLAGMQIVAQDANLPLAVQGEEVRGGVRGEVSGSLLPGEDTSGVSLEDTPGASQEDIAGEIHLPMIEEAARDLMARQCLTRDDYDALDAQSRDHAFTVAGLESERAIEKVRDALAEAVTEGYTLEQFKRRVEQKAGKGTFLSEGHAETVFRTGMQSLYSDGLDKMLGNPMVADLFPYRERISIEDSRRTDICEVLEHSGLDGTNVYRADDPTWQRTRPPSHFSCRTTFRGLTVEQAAARGVREAIRWLETGRPPVIPEWVAPPDVELPEGWEAGAFGLSLMRLGGKSRQSPPARLSTQAMIPSLPLVEEETEAETEAEVEVSPPPPPVVTVNINLDELKNVLAKINQQQTSALNNLANAITALATKPVPPAPEIRVEPTLNLPARQPISFRIEEGADGVRRIVPETTPNPSKEDPL